MPSQDDAGDANNNQEAEKWPEVSVGGGVKNLLVEVFVLKTYLATKSNDQQQH